MSVTDATVDDVEDAVEGAYPVAVTAERAGGSIEVTLHAPPQHVADDVVRVIDEWDGLTLLEVNQHTEDVVLEVTSA